MDSLTSLSFIELGLNFRDADKLNKILKDRQIVCKKHFYNVVDVKIRDEERDIYSMYYYLTEFCRDIYHHNTFINSSTISFLRTLVGLFKFYYIDKPHLEQIVQNHRYQYIMMHFWANNTLSRPFKKKISLRLRSRSSLNISGLIKKSLIHTYFATNDILESLFNGDVNQISFDVEIPEKYKKKGITFKNNEYEYQHSFTFFKDIEFDTDLKTAITNYKSKVDNMIKKFNAAYYKKTQNNHVEANLINQLYLNRSKIPMARILLDMPRMKQYRSRRIGQYGQFRFSKN